MDDLLGFVSANKVYIGVGLIALVYFWESVKSFFRKKINVTKATAPKVTGPKECEKIHHDDLSAIRYLMNRAVESGNTSLQKELKSINAKFFDINYSDTGPTA